MKPNHYKSCNELPILNLFQLIQTKDPKYLLVDVQNLEEKDIKAYIQGNEKNLTECISEIIAEYQALRFSRKDANQLKEQGEICYLEGLVKVIQDVIKLYPLEQENEVRSLLGGIPRHKQREGRVARKIHQ